MKVVKATYLGKVNQYNPYAMQSALLKLSGYRKGVAVWDFSVYAPGVSGETAYNSHFSLTENLYGVDWWDLEELQEL